MARDHLSPGVGCQQCRDPKNPDAQAANLGGQVERYIHTHYFAAAR
jgi:hypothetical protein